MGHVFVSYSHRDRDRVEELVRALESAGVDVWWDTELPDGADWDEQIQRALEQSRAIFVVWSDNSMRSREVRAEATYGLKEEKLFPVRIEDIEIWARYAIVQYRDLFERPPHADPNWPTILESLRGRVTQEEVDAIAEEINRHDDRPDHRRAGTAIVMPKGVVLPTALVGSGMFAFLGWVLTEPVVNNPFLGAAVALVGAGFVSSLVPLFRGAKGA